MNIDAQTASMPGFFQMGYVTSDFDGAIAGFQKSLGISRFLRLRRYRFPTRVGREAVCDFALAYVGPVQFEIIHPIEGDVQVYASALDESSVLARLHHIARLYDSHQALEQQLSQYRARGLHIPIDSGVAGFSRYFYADLRAEIGSYIECCLFEEGARSFLDSIPHN